MSKQGREIEKSIKRDDGRAEIEMDEIQKSKKRINETECGGRIKVKRLALHYLWSRDASSCYQVISLEAQLFYSLILL